MKVISLGPALLPLHLNGLVLAVLVWVAGTGCVAMGFRAAPYRPHIDPADFQAKVDNPYFPLVPGTITKFVEKSGDETREIEVTVTHDTKTILDVKCVVVRDILTQNGVLKEDTHDWFAQDKAGAVWYFGEATKEFTAGGMSTQGSWEGGAFGAQPGIIMPAHPEVGGPYRQEYYRGEAEDMGQVIALDDSVTVPFGSFTGCVRTKEWSVLEAGSEKKWYAKGVGVVRTESTAGEVATLVSVIRE